ncbi:MAG: HNH endonuclease [Deltaproteobacteria bacterium]|nr:MAG: HNH endonuclease [Deltaproteobacteria bacterium]
MDYQDEKNFCRLNRRWSMWVQSKTCALCGEAIKVYEDSSVDHIIPVSRGGKDTESNVQITHVWCNNQKGDLLPWQDKIFRFLNKHFFKIRKGKINK